MPDEVREQLTRDPSPFLHPEPLQTLQIHSYITLHLHLCIYIYIYAFIRRFYPKRLTLHCIQVTVSTFFQVLLSLGTLPKVLEHPLLMNRFNYFSHFHEYKS